MRKQVQKTQATSKKHLFDMAGKGQLTPEVLKKYTSHDLRSIVKGVTALDPSEQVGLQALLGDTSTEELIEQINAVLKEKTESASTDARMDKARLEREHSFQVFKVLNQFRFSIRKRDKGPKRDIRLRLNTVLRHRALETSWSKEDQTLLLEGKAGETGLRDFKQLAIKLHESYNTMKDDSAIKQRLGQILNLPDSSAKFKKVRKFKSSELKAIYRNIFPLFDIVIGSLGISPSDVGTFYSNMQGIAAVVEDHPVSQYVIPDEATKGLRKEKGYLFVYADSSVGRFFVANHHDCIVGSFEHTGEGKAYMKLSNAQVAKHALFAVAKDILDNPTQYGRSKQTRDPLEILAIKQALNHCTIAFQVGGGYVIKLPAIAYKGVSEVLQAAIHFSAADYQPQAPVLPAAASQPPAPATSQLKSTEMHVSTSKSSDEETSSLLEGLVEELFSTSSKTGGPRLVGKPAPISGQIMRHLEEIIKLINSKLPGEKKISPHEECVLAGILFSPSQKTTAGSDTERRSTEVVIQLESLSGQASLAKTLTTAFSNSDAFNGLQKLLEQRFPNAGKRGIFHLNFQDKLADKLARKTTTPLVVK